MPLASAPQGGGNWSLFRHSENIRVPGVFKLPNFGHVRSQGRGTPFCGPNRGHVVYEQPLKGNHHRRKEHAKHSLFTQKRFLHNFLWKCFEKLGGDPPPPRINKNLGRGNRGLIGASGRFSAVFFRISSHNSTIEILKILHFWLFLE